MGMAKNYWMELQERGYGEAPDTLVCEGCFSDEGLKEFIEENGSVGVCSYCGAESDTVLSLESVLSHIVDSLSTEWTDAADSGTPYVTREGGYLGPVFDTYDLLQEQEPIETESQDLFNDISETIYDTLWARSFVMPYEEEAIQEDWLVLVHAIRHQARFIIFHENASAVFEENFSWQFNDPRAAITHIANTIERLGMVRVQSKDTPIYRARFSYEDIDWCAAAQMGTVPYRLAKQANRMSPVGISMFYGALEPETARAELGVKDKPGIIHYGTFYPSRDLTLIDFTTAPYVPSIYSKDRESRSDIRLMRGFIKDFSKPILRDEFEHLEYIPTQVITEYLRFNFKYNSNKIDGILFNSAQDKKKSCVLFVDNESCVDKDAHVDADSLTLRLVDYKKEKLS